MLEEEAIMEFVAFQSGYIGSRDYWQVGKVYICINVRGSVLIVILPVYLDMFKAANSLDDVSLFSLLIIFFFSAVQGSKDDCVCTRRDKKKDRH